MQLLLPECRPTSPEELASGLGLGDQAPPERPYLVLNMVSSLDGKASIDGRSTAGSSTAYARRPTRSWSGPAPCVLSATDAW